MSGRGKGIPGAGSVAMLAAIVVLVSCRSERGSPDAVNAYDPMALGSAITQAELLDAHVRKAMEEWQVPGLAIVVVRDDSIWFARGYGVREWGRPEPVDTRTVFGLLSPTKTFTTTALAMLVEDGRISWDDPVVKHLPRFRVSDPARTRDLRIRDIASHRTGYVDDHRVWYGTGHDSHEIMRRMADLQPVAAMRTGFHYNNLMYVVAGELIEAASGVTWQDFVEQRIFEPLGMHQSTSTMRTALTRTNLATPHARRVAGRFGPVRPIRYFDADNIAPAGMIHTNVEEMAGWLLLHLNGGVVGGSRLLTPTSVRELQTPHTVIGDLEDPRLGGDRAFGPLKHFADSLGYGLGWITMKYRGERALLHGGGINGQRSSVGVLPDRGAGVVILSNLQDTEIALALTYQVFDLVLGAEPRDWSAAYRR